MGFAWPSNGAGWRHESWGPLEFWQAAARSRVELSRANRRVVCIELASFLNTNGGLPNGSRLSCAASAGGRKWASSGDSEEIREQDENHPHNCDDQRA